MIPAKLQEHLDTLALFPDRPERIEALIALADEFRGQPPADVPRDAEHRIPACESEVYARSRLQPDGTLAFEYAVDNPQGISAMALARILEDSLSGADLREVAAVPDDVVYTIFGRELSMGKSAGLIGMVQKARMEAERRLR